MSTRSNSNSLRPSADVSGEYIAGQADARNIPQQIISAKSGICPTTISKIYSGARKANGRQLFRIAVAIGEAGAEQARRDQRQKAA